MQGNFIGTDATGNQIVPNTFGGIAVFDGAHGVLIGGTNAAARNVISGNDVTGIYLLGSGASNNIIQGNYIGLNPAGTAAVPNDFAGIYVLGGAQNNLIGGTNAGAANIISGNNSEGIFMADPGTTNNLIIGNRIGTDAAGANGVPNGFTGIGVWNGAQNNFIGGTNAGARNLISGNGGHGIVLGDTNTSFNVIQGNLIGTTTNGLNPLGNGYTGVNIRNGASSNLIGGASSAARNIISGNAEDGVNIADPGTVGNQVVGNYLGVNINGTAAVPNQQSGVAIIGGAFGNTIGTPDPATRNILAGNLADGVYLTGPSNTVQGNYIGTSISGLTAISNTFEGVVILGVSGNQIGGTAAGAGNVISANQGHGIYISDSGATGNIIQGNNIGVGADGLTKLGNVLEGIALLNGSASNLIGGTSAAARNILSGNSAHGVWIGDPGTIGNLVQGNNIGVAADGTTAVSNLLENVVILNGAQGNIIGFDTPGAGAGNIIAYSGREGVAIYDDTTTSNTVRGNAIFNNALLGINLASSGEDSFRVTPNDSQDPDLGPNHLQNFPTITTASVSSGTTSISGTLNSTPNRNFQIDLYRNTAADPSGHGEGQVYLGHTSLATDVSGNGTYTFNSTGSFTGQFIAATATDTTSGDTSEFSASVIATNSVSAPPVITFTGPFSSSNGGFGFNATLQPNIPYRIQATTNLSDTNAWVTLTNFTPTASPISFTDPSATNLVRRFYRIVTP